MFLVENSDIQFLMNNMSYNLDWGYRKNNGPKKWSKIKDEYCLCEIGKFQSPIDIIPNKTIKLPSIDIKYGTNNIDITHDKYTLLVKGKHNFHIKSDGKKFQLDSFHFHTPSENLLLGKRFPMEIHFVHKPNENYRGAVISVFVKEGEQHKEFEKIINIKTIAPQKHHIDKEETLNFNKFLPSNRDYITFIGSITYPPCTEEIIWFAIKEPIEFSKKQIETYREKYFKDNTRSLQPSNNRDIFQNKE